MYCVKFLDPLCGNFGFFTEGNEGNEGFRSGEATREAVSFAYNRRPPRRTPHNCRFASIRVIRGLSFLQANLFQERYEARLGANRIPHGVDFHFWQPGGVLVNRSFEPVQRF